MGTAAAEVEIVHPTPALAPQGSTAVTPMDMLASAIERGAGLDVIEKFMSLAERWEANQARKAFLEAFAAFKSEAVAVIRNKLVTDGPLKGKSYAELTAFVEAVTPALSQHGLSASWELTRDEKDWIEVTCKIEHVLGHSKRVSMGGPPDVGGAKNAMQARASTVTYLERYTLKAACGLAERGDDDDGKGGSATTPAITAEQDDEIKKLIQARSDPVAALAKFLSIFKIASTADLPARDYARAKQALTAAPRDKPQ